MGSEWRFRVNWYGKVILQRKWKYYHPNMQLWDYVWKDAKSTDLNDYYKGGKQTGKD